MACISGLPGNQRLLLQACSFVLAGRGACSNTWLVNNTCKEPQAYVQLTTAVLMHPGPV